MSSRSLKSRIFPVVGVLSVYLLIGFGPPCAAQPPGNPLDQYEDFFETLSEQAGPLAPMFGKLSQEQIERIASVRVSVADENQFGQKVLDAYVEQLDRSKIAITVKGKDVHYLQTLCNGLRGAMKNGWRYRRFDVRIIETESTDAYSVPGGRILVTRGLLESCGSEAALVGTLAHELSHLDRGHQLLSLKQSKLAQQPLNLADGMLLISMVARPFRPEQESEADRDATEWMMTVGYDPSELARLLNTWDQRQAQEMPWMKFMPSRVKSHPNPGRRAQEILVIAEPLRKQYPGATHVGVDNLANRIPKSQGKRR